MFNEGDVVYLKSGSAKMTVVRVFGNMVDTTWIHYATGEARNMSAPVAAFRHADPRRANTPPRRREPTSIMEQYNPEEDEIPW